MHPQGMSNQDLTEAYICNQLTALQRNQFEEALQHDVDLLFEYRWQRDIIRCLQYYRKQQLKDRLEAVG